VCTKTFLKLVQLAQMSPALTLGISASQPVEMRIEPAPGMLVRCFCAPRQTE
jgi:hypothetical protein